MTVTFYTLNDSVKLVWKCHVVNEYFDLDLEYLITFSAVFKNFASILSI